MADPATPQYDPKPLLTWFALLLVAGSVVALSIIVCYQLYTKGEADNVWVAQLAGVIGWSLGKAGEIYSNSYGTTKQSQEKDTTIATQARTAAALQGVAAPAVIPTNQETKP